VSGRGTGQDIDLRIPALVERRPARHLLGSAPDAFRLADAVRELLKRW
jgi:hypothetical protein